MTTSPAPKQWFHIGPPVLAVAEPQSPAEEPKPATTADVYLFDEIGGWWGATAEDFVKEVAGLDVDRIVLHLNSPGGAAKEGVAIANVLRAHRAHVEVRVDGWAASAASVIAMAGNEIVMGVGSQMMIHDAWGFAQGDASEMRKAADMLDSTSDSLAAAYAARTGIPAAEWRAVMKAESWYTAEEAVQAGLADRAAAADETGTASDRHITPGARSSSSWDLWDSLASVDRFDTRRFAYAGRAAAPPPRIPARPAPAASTQSTPPGAAPNTRGAGMDPAKIREALGLTADASDDEVKAALTSAGLTAASTAPAPDTEPVAKPKPGNAPGTMTVDVSAWQDREDRLKRLEAQEGKRRIAERDQILNQAVIDGKFAPARKEHWARLWDADPEGTREVVAGLTKNVVAVSEIGSAGDDSEFDDEFARFFSPTYTKGS
ncbi:Clp protease ClpP [Actinoplanes sichuanensis]|uniref:ATP-dependent Clp protease proteolytic subunit n=1 Tax=Actinoplanes sichuanensis TaxID=512349 RepID=A0ABW4A6Q3_9ACTN|nr:head maturation protease, ClpP-related [Actinoplanes sichuanensis]BEL07837.1 Clp protease ClpP [Actinoplanes sichuanensis]